MPATEERVMVVAPFGVEIDAARNNDVLLQSIPGCRLRSAIDGAKPIIDAKTGEAMIPKDQAIDLGSFPRTPGMQVHANPAELTYVIIDPLHDDEELCETIHKWMSNNSPFSMGDKIKGLPAQEGTLDQHRMKNLCRELLWLIESGDAKKVKGPLPTMEEVEELPGYFLLNPGSQIGYTQPRYEKDWESWVSRLTQSGE